MDSDDSYGDDDGSSFEELEITVETHKTSWSSESHMEDGHLNLNVSKKGKGGYDSTNEELGVICQQILKKRFDPINEVDSDAREGTSAV